jgi:hypothetical protein
MGTNFNLNLYVKKKFHYNTYQDFGRWHLKVRITLTFPQYPEGEDNRRTLHALWGNTTDSCARGCGAFRHDFCTCKWFVFFVFLKFTISVLKRLKEGPPSPWPPPQPTKKRPGRKPKATPPEDTPATAPENIPAPRCKILSLLFGPQNWTLCSKKRRIRNLRISKSFYFSIKALPIRIFSNPRDWN